MVVFDLREEARLVSYLYAVGGGGLFFWALTLVPRAWRSRLPEALAEASRPLALVFTVAAAVMLWVENDERTQAEALVADCLRGACTVVEGLVDEVDPLREFKPGSRYGTPSWRSGFRVGDAYFFYYPPDFSHDSPTNHLRPGDWVRVYSHDKRLVLVEVDYGRPR